MSTISGLPDEFYFVIYPKSERPFLGRMRAEGWAKLTECNNMIPVQNTYTTYSEQNEVETKAATYQSKH